MKKIHNFGLTFDDLLLLPNYTDIKRDQVDLSIQLTPKIKLTLPVLSSPMDTVTETSMAIAMGKSGGLGIIHRNLPINEQAQMIKTVKKENLFVGAAIGIGQDLEERTTTLIKNDVDILLIDSAHGHSKFIIETIKYIKSNFPKIPIIAGNIATFEGAKALIEAGADILRVGIGPGSICTTRIISGMGVPQATAISEVAKAVKKTNIKIIADGGIKQTGDMAKALGLGAHCVMLGSLLARYEQSPGKIKIIDGKQYKIYRGMGSSSAMIEGSAARYGQSNTKNPNKLIAEGVEGLVEFKGNVSDYLFQIEGSIRSSFYYLGSKNISEFHKKARFIQISNASLKESHPHSIIISEPGKNYNL